uniref:Putative ovule protein n=1 Tax=Solanum chacoense TaxID=4108 RepID=A0A0V0GI53_SOLCH
MSTLKGLPDSPCSYLLGHQDSAMMCSLALVFLIEELMTFRHLHLCKWKIGSPELYLVSFSSGTIQKFLLFGFELPP